MSITAVVENNSVRLPPGVHLPDGTPVQIAFEPAPAEGSAEDDPLYRLAELAEPMGALTNAEMDAAIYGR
jgi:hypothetical protein